MWTSIHQELGRVKEDTKQEVRFLNSPIPKGFEIGKLESSCGCTVPVYDTVSGMLTAGFSAGKIPKHLEWKGEYTTTKKVIAHTSEGDQTLTFRATIYRQ